MGKTCGDCVYCGTANGWAWQNSEHCNKQNIDVDFDRPACAYFKEDSSDCCYNCTYFNSGLISGGKCTYHSKKISSPASYVCSSFVED
ncbi:MAG: hypothetical protein HDT23_03665 [Ruminococcus sp.]|nr:hypothetical protein [Ruminococcus sp.]